jgi:hypothetical protein
MENIFMQSELMIVIPAIQIIYLPRDIYMAQYYGCHKDRKEEQIFKYVRKISHLQN